jgi:hypothetical protein
MKDSDFVPADAARMGCLAARMGCLAAHTGCRLIGCFVLALLIVAAMCALAAFGVLSLARPAHAATPSPPARAYVLLVDQSGSVAHYDYTRNLAREITLAAVEQLRAAGSAGDTLEVIFFGAQPTSAISPTLLHDEQLIPHIQAAFARSRALGATLFDQAFELVLRDGREGAIVIVISDGLPEDATLRTAAERASYRARLAEQANRFARRRMSLFFVLLGAEPREWPALWEPLTGETGGRVIGIRSRSQVQETARWLIQIIHDRAARPSDETAAPTATLPGPSPAPTRPLPAQTPRNPMATLTAATSVAIEDVADQPFVPAVQAAGTPPPAATTEAPTPAGEDGTWMTILAGVLRMCLVSLAGLCVVAGAVVLLAGAALRRRRTRLDQAPSPADEGCLEIYDPETDEVQRVDLRPHTVGEILTIGSGAGCDIQLDIHTGEGVMAAITFTPNGPRIESREAPLYFDGRNVRQHLLFDNDVLYLDRFVFYYHNFFRQRALDEEAIV